MQPRIVTLAELTAVLVPLCRGNKWAEGSIVDLWKKGAPVPQPEGEPERRILIPEQFALWWDDFNQRLGTGITVESTYQPLSRVFLASAGHRLRRK